jgi:hypothetical protein
MKKRILNPVVYSNFWSLSVLQYWVPFKPMHQLSRNSCTNEHKRNLNVVYYFKLFVPCILLTYEIKDQQMSLFQFYSYIDGSLHVLGLQAHPQENSRSCSHNHWFSGCSVRVEWPERYSHWTNGCVSSCVNSPDDGPVGPKHVEIRRYMNKIEIVTSVGFSFHKYIIFLTSAQSLQI